MPALLSLNIQIRSKIELNPKHFLAAILLGVLLAPSVFASRVPTGRAAPETVTLPWEQFMDLWERYRTPEAARSYDFAYQQARYHGTATLEKNDYHLRFEAVLRIEALQDKHILVPVLAAGVNPESMSIDGKSAGWVAGGEYYHILINTKGPHEIKARYTFTLDARSWPRKLKLPLVPIPKSEITLQLADQDVDVSLNPGVVLEAKADASSGDFVHGIVPAVSSVAVRWLKHSEKAEMIPLKMGAVVHTYVALGENGAHLQSDVDFQILQGETHYFTLLVPKSIDILDVAGGEGSQAISQWYSEEQDNGDLIHIYASRRQNRRFRVRLDGEQTRTRSNYVFDTPHIVPRTVERYENLIAVGSTANVEIAEAAVTKAEGRDVRFLPDALKQFAGGRALFYYKILDADYDLRFEVKSHERAAVVKTRIERLEADSVVMESGTVMTKAGFSIKNNQAQYLRLKLPAESKLLSAFTNGREIQPAMDGDRLVLPLDKSSEKAFPVEIAWFSNIGRFRLLGQGEILLPAGDIVVGELAWRLYMPREYQVLHFGGTVSLTSPGLHSILPLLADGPAFHLTATAQAGEASKSYRYNTEGLKHRFKTGKKLEAADRERDIISNQVQVQIPVTGNFYRFESYLVKGFTPAITFFYVDGAVQTAVAFFYGLLGFAAALWLAALILEPGGLPQKMRQLPVCLKALAAAVPAALLPLVLKLGVFSAVLQGIGFALICFAFWQNRREAVRFHARVEGFWRLLPEILLLGLTLCVGIALMVGFGEGALFFSFASILLHVAVFRLHKLLADHRRRKGTTAVGLVLLMTAAAALTASDVRAGAPGEVPRAAASRTGGGKVNLSWPTLEEMLRKIEAEEQKKLDQPDAAYLFGRATVAGEITEKYAALDIDVPLTVIKPGFVRIPLFFADTPVSQVLYNGRPLALVKDGETIYFETDFKTALKGDLQVKIVAPVHETGGVKEFAVRSPMLQGGRVTLQFGTDIKSVRLYNISWEKRNGRTIRAALGSAQRLQGELATFVRRRESADESEKRVKKRYATTYTLATLEDEIATFYSSIRYRILNEHVQQFDIRMPAHVVVHEIVGEDLQRWRAVETVDGMTTYRINVSYPVADRYDLSVRYEVAMPKGEKRLQVPCLMVDGVARDTGYVGVEMRGRSEISITRLEKARLIDVRELPALIRADADSPFVYALRYIERPYTIQFDLRKHRSVRMDPAIADRIDYTRVVSERGKVLSQARIWVRNSRKQYAAFQLPKGSRLVSSFLDGKSVKPSVNEKGTLLLPLKRQSVTPFVLDVVFEDADVPVHLLGGGIALTYPQIDLPISMVNSNVYIPQSMQVFSLGGDFSESQAVNYLSWSSSRRIDPMLGYPAEQGTVTPVDPNLSTNMEPQPGGTHSLLVHVPKRGRSLAMSTFYVPNGEKLTTTVFMIHAYLLYSAKVLAFLVTLFIGGGLKDYRRRPSFWGASAVVGILAHLLLNFTWKTLIAGVILGGVLRWGLERIKRWRSVVA